MATRAKFFGMYFGPIHPAIAILPTRQTPTRAYLSSSVMSNLTHKPLRTVGLHLEVSVLMKRIVWIYVRACMFVSIGTPEQKAALSTLMEQHANQVSSLQAEKRELNDTIGRQVELLSATLQVSVGNTRCLCARSIPTPTAQVKNITVNVAVLNSLEPLCAW